jgi:hypothetical protein
MLNHEQLHQEFEGDYLPVFTELKKLERDYPLVHTNQDKIIDDEMAILVNTYASLLYSAQDDAPVVRTPKEVRDALLVLQDVNGFREMITDLVQRFFPQVIIVIERLYFQNRAAIKHFKLPEGERQMKNKNFEAREWIYPEHRIERLRDLSRKIWRECVLTTPER